MVQTREQPGRHGTGDSTYATTRALDDSSSPAPLVLEEAGLVAGTLIGRYMIIDTLGEGGMGRVYRAFDPKLNRRVALKVLRHALESEQRRRLVREAQAMAQLSHPHVVHVYEVGEHRGLAFVVMELVPGQTLRQWQRQVPRPDWRTCVEIYQQVGEGLAAAHHKGLVHRDFKPNNAIVDEQRRVRVLDFGLARTVGGPSSSADFEDGATEPYHSGQTGIGGGPIDDPLTKAGVVLGTLGYMPPEQMQGKLVDERGDQFSFCVSLYEAVYGSRPFVGQTADKLEARIRKGTLAPTPPDCLAPANLHEVLVRGLAYDPADRWPSMEALLEQLRQRVVPPEPGRRARGGRLGLGLAALGVGLVALAFVNRQVHESELSQRCSGARAELVGVWDDARREQVQAALLGTERAYAVDTWVRVEAQLDEYVEAWIHEHTDVCEATSVRHEQSQEVMDLRMGCLFERKEALRAAVDVLAEASGEVVINAVEVVGRVPRLDRCDDVSWLEQRRRGVPLPEEPAAIEAIDVLRGQLAAVEAREHAGEYLRALEQVGPVVERAEVLDYGPLLAEALSLRGDLRRSAGQYETAEQDLRRAFALAAEHGHTTIVVNTVNALTFLLGYAQARHQLALEWGAMGLALSQGPQLEPTAHADALFNVGSVLVKQGKFDEALEHYQRALAIDERVLGSGDLGLARTLKGLGGVLAEQGKYREALEQYRRALALYEQALGPQHPSLASVLNRIGIVFDEQGEYKRALEHYRRALAIYERTFGSEHTDYSGVLNNIGLVLDHQGKREEALDYHQRALVIDQKVLDPLSLELAKALYNMGSILSSHGRFEEALRHHRQALAIYEQILEPGHPEFASVLNNIGTVLGRQGALDEALDHFERALAIRERALGPQHPDLAEQLNNIGFVWRLQGKYEQALESYHRSLFVLEHSFGSAHPDIATLLVNIARLYRAWDRIEQAHDYYRRALLVQEQVSGPEHLSNAEILLELAGVALEAEQPAAAREHAERAVSIYEASAADSRKLSAARFTLGRALWSERAKRARARAQVELALGRWVECGADCEDKVAEARAWLAAHRLR